jgi:hypothetical protein
MLDLTFRIITASEDFPLSREPAWFFPYPLTLQQKRHFNGNRNVYDFGEFLVENIFRGSLEPTQLFIRTHNINSLYPIHNTGLIAENDHIPDIQNGFEHISSQVAKL